MHNLSDFGIEITDNAIEEIKKAIGEQNYFCLAIVGGKSVGFQYHIDVKSNFKEEKDYYLVEKNNLKILLEKKSISYLNDVIIIFDNVRKGLILQQKLFE